MAGKRRGDRLNRLTDEQIDALAKKAVAGLRAQLEKLSDDDALDLCRGIYQGMKAAFLARVAKSESSIRPAPSAQSADNFAFGKVTSAQEGATT